MAYLRMTSHREASMDSACAHSPDPVPRPAALPKWLRTLLAVTAAALALTACPGDDGPSDDEYRPAQGTRVLPLTPIAQQTEVWCWAASAEMVLRYYGLPNLNPAGNYQCGIVAVYYGPYSPCWQNCFACVSAIGTASELQSLINNYGFVASQFVPSRVLSSRLVFSALNFNATAKEIDEGRPIVAGISPSGYSYPNISQHAVVIVGYQNDGNGQRILINDPFPYDAFPGSPNPYLAVGGARVAAGRYSVTYSALVEQLRWGNTIDKIR
jgi:hypothetical protein